MHRTLRKVEMSITSEILAKREIFVVKFDFSKAFLNLSSFSPFFFNCEPLKYFRDFCNFISNSILSCSIKNSANRQCPWVLANIENLLHFASLFINLKKRRIYQRNSTKSKAASFNWSPKAFDKENVANL